MCSRPVGLGAKRARTVMVADLSRVVGLFTDGGARVCRTGNHGRDSDGGRPGDHAQHAHKGRQEPTVAKKDFRSVPGRMPRPNAWVCTDTAWLSEPADGRVSVDRRISS